MHETTQLCIRQIKKYVTPETTLLDVGCGSGILSIVALKLGAESAVGTDLDPCAITATEENTEVNGIPKEKFEVMIGNIIDDKEETVVEAVKAAGLEVLEVTYQGEWVSVTARKNG